MRFVLGHQPQAQNFYVWLWHPLKLMRKMQPSKLLQRYHEYANDNSSLCILLSLTVSFISPSPPLHYIQEPNPIFNARWSLCSRQTVVVKSKIYTFLRLTLTLKYLHLIMIDNFRTVQVLWLWSSSQWGWLWMASISIRGVLSWENSTTISPAFFIAWWDLFIWRCSLSIFPYYYQWVNKALICLSSIFRENERGSKIFIKDLCS